MHQILHRQADLCSLSGGKFTRKRVRSMRRATPDVLEVPLFANVADVAVQRLEFVPLLDKKDLVCPECEVAIQLRSAGYLLL
jgi:hypothetical protein